MDFYDYVEVQPPEVYEHLVWSHELSNNNQVELAIKKIIECAKEKADEARIPLLFDTDMKAYAEMYQHFGCELYNTVSADNGVIRYSLCYKSN